MVEMASRKPVLVVRMLDRQGRPIGQVIHPTVAPVVGRGAGTVLLVRGREGALLRDPVLRAG
jgi:hypothetical protein